MTRKAVEQSGGGELPPKTEHVAACLFCHGERGGVEAEGVRDWFFDCVDIASTFLRCADCESLWIEDRLTEAELPRAYAQYYTHAPALPKPDKPGFRDRVRNSYAAVQYGGSRSPLDLAGAAAYRLLSRDSTELDAAYRFANRAPGNLLDYGCGSGQFLRQMQALGYDVQGVDFDPVAARAVRELGISVITPQEAGDLDWGGKFDTITLSHVIEHVPDPIALLQTLRGWIRPSGVLYLEVPSANAWGLQTFGTYWRGLEAPRHLGIPSAKGLELALHSAGFTIERRVVRNSVRSWLWAQSLEASPPEARATLHQTLQHAPQETMENAEFLTIVARPRDV